MNNQMKGHCKHGEFNLTDGCPECIAEGQAEAAADITTTEPGLEPDPATIGAELAAAAQEPAPMETLPAPLTMLQAIDPDYVEPGLLQVCQEAERLREFAVARVIATNEDLKPATEDLSLIAKAKKVILDKKKEIVAPFKAKVETINAAFADILQPLEEADRITRDKVKEFRDIEREKLALARREAASKGGQITVELQKPVPEHTRTGLGTQGFQKVHKWEVVDKSQVPLDYLTVDGAKIMAVVKSSKGTISIPGIRIWTDEVVRINPK